jgi:hypothetical protein
MRENFQEYFDRYEVESGKSSFHKFEHYFMRHYDASKKSKRRWCSFSNNDIIAIQVDDPHYKKLINDLLDSYENRESLKGEELMTELYKNLEELNYYDDVIFQKIGIDVTLEHIFQPTSNISSNL